MTGTSDVKPQLCMCLDSNGSEGARSRSGRVQTIMLASRVHMG